MSKYICICIHVYMNIALHIVYTQYVIRTHQLSIYCIYVCVIFYVRGIHIYIYISKSEQLLYSCSAIIAYSNARQTENMSA